MKTSEVQKKLKNKFHNQTGKVFCIIVVEDTIWFQVSTKAEISNYTLFWRGDNWEVMYASKLEDTGELIAKIYGPKYANQETQKHDSLTYAMSMLSSVEEMPLNLSWARMLEIAKKGDPVFGE